MSTVLCATCGVEHAERPAVCAICADERQYVPAGGQRWTSIAELSAGGTVGRTVELEPGLVGIEARPSVGIGQQAKLVTSVAGSVLWDPLGFVDERLAATVLEHGPVRAIVASHPHMFGVQLEWSRLLGDAPVLVAEADARWLQRQGPAVALWSGVREVLPGVTLHQLGGHFPGSAVLHLPGHDGAGVLLAGDTVFPNPDRASVGFLRSYPNRLPLSPAVVQRMARALADLPIERVYGNFDNVIPRAGAEVIARSAERHVEWVTGVHDSET